MPFDPKLLADFAEREIRDFARNHMTETFYGFAIDASLLCLNSVEMFNATLTQYQNSWPDMYFNPVRIAELKMGTGDWEYQGFADFSGQQGWDESLYELHYEIGFEDDSSPLLATSEYALGMQAVLELLNQRHAFSPLKTSEDFWAGRVEHNY